MRLSILLLLVAACGSDPGAVRDGALGDDGDSSGSGDGAVDSAVPVTCGGETCREDQSCVADVCTFSCTGSQVPGDYATVNAAATALSGTANSVICLAAASYPITGLIYGTDLTIVGVSASKTTLTSQNTITFRGNITLKGLTVDAHVDLDGFNGSATATGIKITGGLEIERGSFSAGPSGQRATIDGADIAGGIRLWDPFCDHNCEGDIVLELRNSYVHDAEACINLQQTDNLADIFLTATNNTIVGCERGLYVTIPITPSSGNNTIALHNNIFANHTMFAIDYPGSRSTVTTSNNALFGNTTNYNGAALDGPGYVKQNCLLDTATPPGLGAGSPCVGAADAAHVSPTDFFGRPRSAPFDIGAIEP